MGEVALGAPPEARADEPQASLRFARAPDGQSFIRRQRVGYPYHITRPFYLDAEPAGALTLYLQSVSGGIYEHETLRMTLAAEPDALAHVTTQAGTIAHRMSEGFARQAISLEAGAGALLEYLPDPLILFPGSRLDSRVDITAVPGATLLASESFTQHDPAGGGRVFDWFGAETRIRDEAGRLLALDRYRVDGGGFETGRALAADWPAQGSLVVVRLGAAHGPLRDALREALAGADAVYAGVSELPNACGVSVRVLAREGAGLRDALDRAWVAVRMALYGRAPGPRRK